MVWDKEEGLVCIDEYSEALKQYEEQLEATKELVSSYGVEDGERVVLSRIEKQAYITLYSIDEHSDLVAEWTEYERKNTENTELERLRKKLQEVHTYRKSMVKLMKDVTDILSMSNPASQDVALERIYRWLEENKPVGQEGEGNHEQEALPKNIT
ncbi:hypothetical protein ACTHQ2_22070 [Bacillus subtilis]|uniref:hypothetical protein n=2 Tax=Bacillales TaxID=1385 RepID=UPI003F7B40A2